MYRNMVTLENDWLMKGLIDFEYKKYQLLAYLKHVQGSFEKLKLYPFLNDLAFHYKNILSVKNGKSLLEDTFSKSISAVDLANLNLAYKKIVDDDEVMKQIEEIINYAIPCFEDAIEEGKDLYDYIESNFEITSVGLTPLYKEEGYFFIDNTKKKEANVYQYKITIFQQADGKYRGLNVQFIESSAKSLFETYEQKKIELIKRFKDLPNPATYLITTKLNFPYNETIIPVAKRLLVRYISNSE